DEGALTYSGLYKAFRRLAERAGIAEEVFGPHSMRHAFGRDMTLAGMPTRELQIMMGHSNPKVAQIYTRFSSAQLQEAHRRYSPLSNADITLRREFSKIARVGGQKERSGGQEERIQAGRRDRFGN
ncbi:MAG: tyrosine-type recombinase/integrase, partial [Chloroflexota bacterium]